MFETSTWMDRRAEVELGVGGHPKDISPFLFSIRSIT